MERIKYFKVDQRSKTDQRENYKQIEVPDEEDEGKSKQRLKYEEEKYKRKIQESIDFLVKKENELKLASDKFVSDKEQLQKEIGELQLKIKAKERSLGDRNDATFKRAKEAEKILNDGQASEEVKMLVRKNFLEIIESVTEPVNQ